ncbi:MAG TPA: DUF3310 domain-containing protein [Bacteroidia bacterium]|nr:DUF3310 domain-containing protein [Bacteroidia bacterium]
MQFNIINKAEHYNTHSSGIECIDIIENLSFCLGSAIKYVWRAGLKSDNKKQDLEKAIYYLKREQERLEEIGYMYSQLNINVDYINKISFGEDLLALFFQKIKELTLPAVNNTGLFVVFSSKKDNILLNELIKFINKNIN